MDYSVFDAHCDTLCRISDEGQGLKQNTFNVDSKRMGAYRKYTQVFACFIDPVYHSCAVQRCMRLIDTFYTSGADGILSIEGGECIRSLADLRNYARLGVRAAALTWNGTNHIAAGADEQDKTKGLTPFGKSVVNEMDNTGMLIDVSHLNDKSFYDIAEFYGKTLIATHSDSRSVCSHRRNLTDDMFRIIKSRGGCVGINFNPPFLNESGSADIDDIIKHIEHFMSLGGENSIGIGADFDGVESLPHGINGCEDTCKVFDRLLQLNYTDEQVEKISHKNFERVFENV